MLTHPPAPHLVALSWVGWINLCNVRSAGDHLEINRAQQGVDNYVVIYFFDLRFRAGSR